MKINIILVFVILTSLIISSKSAISKEKNKKQMNLPYLYVVEEGDNLWNISKKHMNNPYLWKKVWNKNKYIENPNLIFPGDQLIFYKPEKPKRKVRRVVKIQKVEKIPVLSVVPKVLDRITIASKRTIESSGFIVTTDNPAGRVIASLEEKDIMGKDDLVYVDIGAKDNTHIGKQYTVYQAERSVIHPITGEKYGYLIKILGVIEIKEIQKNMSLALINRSYSEIEAGSLVMEYTNSAELTIDPNYEERYKEVNGFILTALDNRIAFGLGDVVYIDSGLSSGVTPGDLFVAYRYRGGEHVEYLMEKNETLPKITIGEMRVISVRERSATALITKSKQELEIGEKIEYKRGIIKN